MKTWKGKYEWMGLAGCLDDERFISETSWWDDELREICGECQVRPECARWATEEDVSSVFVVGVRLPDPAYKRGLRSTHDRIRRSIPDEISRRGDI